jgi:conjugal transfer ATP-binding protein TraC
MARVLTALYAASPPGTGIQFHLYASPAIRAPLARYANLRLADDVVPELDTSDAPAGTPTSTAPWPGVVPGTTCRAAGHRCSPHRVTCSATTGWWSASRFPAARRIFSRLEELLLLRDGIRATLHAAGSPSRSWTAEDLINWVSALLDPHRQTGDAIAAHLRRRARAARPGDRPGHAPAH